MPGVWTQLYLDADLYIYANICYMFIPDWYLVWQSAHGHLVHWTIDNLMHRLWWNMWQTELPASDPSLFKDRITYSNNSVGAKGYSCSHSNSFRRPWFPRQRAENGRWSAQSLPECSFRKTVDFSRVTEKLFLLYFRKNAGVCLFVCLCLWFSVEMDQWRWISVTTRGGHCTP